MALAVDVEHRRGLAWSRRGPGSELDDKGLIDEVGMWNRPLSAAEVASLAGGSALPTLQTGLATGSTAHYFRHQFQYNGAPSRTSLSLLPIIDDGAVVYLNGTEIARENLQDDAVFSTFAGTSLRNENEVVTVSVDPGLLVAGANVIAVEIHQDAGDSSDISLLLTLAAVPSPLLAHTWSEAGNLPTFLGL